MVNNSRMPSSKGRKRPRKGEEIDALEEAQQQQQHHLHRKTEESTLEIDDGDEDVEEARIRDLVFGKEEACLFDSFGKEGDDNEASPTGEPAQVGFFEDRNGDATLEALTNDRGLQVGVETGSEEGKKEAAWEDEDDAVLKVDISEKNRLKKLRVTDEETDLTGPEFEKRLRNRFTSSNVTIDWVKAAEEAKSMSKKQKHANSLLEGTGVVTYGAEDGTEEDYDEELFRDSKAFKGKSGGVLEPGYLDIARCKDANQHDPAKAVVRAVSFHPSGEILLTGGFDKTLRLFQIDGVNNHKIHSIFIEDMPITNARFTGTDQAIITGRRPYFYWYDVTSGKVQKVPRIFSSGRVEKRMETFSASPDGRWLAFLGMGGYIIIVSNKNKQWVADFKLNCKEATAVAFSQDSSYVLASGTDGNVFKFDLRSRRCVQRFFNEGGTKTTSLATSPSTVNKLTVVGSDSGVVNVYSDDAFQSGKRVVRPTPLKAIMSLTTPATTAMFSPDGQILAIASSEKRDGLKMIHTASCTPFTNWPTERTPVRYPFAMDFSPGGGFFALGNDRGCVMLYRLRHFTQA